MHAAASDIAGVFTVTLAGSGVVTTTLRLRRHGRVRQGHLARLAATSQAQELRRQCILHHSC